MALLHVDFFSDVLGMSMNMDVLLPQQTQGQIGPQQIQNGLRFPFCLAFLAFLLEHPDYIILERHVILSVPGPAQYFLNYSQLIPAD